MVKNYTIVKAYLRDLSGRGCMYCNWFVSSFHLLCDSLRRPLAGRSRNRILVRFAENKSLARVNERHEGLFTMGGHAVPFTSIIACPSFQQKHPLDNCQWEPENSSLALPRLLPRQLDEVVSRDLDWHWEWNSYLHHPQKDNCGAQKNNAAWEIWVTFWDGIFSGFWGGGTLLRTLNLQYQSKNADHHDVEPELNVPVAFPLCPPSCHSFPRPHRP